MSNVAIRRACETWLRDMPGGLPEAQTQRDNKKFTPTPGLVYQRVNMLPAPPANPTANGGFRRYRGIFQITLAYPYDQGRQRRKPWQT
jgi:hypothetical protein